MKKVERKWALVVAVICTMGTFISGISPNEEGAYVAGEILAKIGLPAIFYYLAFKKKKGKE